MALCALVLGYAPAHGANFCVSTAAALQTALDTAENNGADDLVQVVQGTYQGNFVYDSTESRDLTVEGGYTAGCGARVVNPANTIMDGMTTGMVLKVQSNRPTDFAVDGLTLRAGSTGGLVTNTNLGTVTLTNNAIHNNSGSGNGGGLSVSGGAIVALTNNTIHHNSSINGGGVFISGSFSVTLTNNAIHNNSGSGGYGGGLSVSGSSAVTLTNNTIYDNAANSNYGGGAYLSGTTVTLTNNTIYGNSAYHGGGVDLSSSGTSTLTNNTIYDNSAYHGGGVVKFNGCGTLTLTNNTIYGNSAGGVGGGVDLAGGGGSVTLTNNTITGNAAGQHGGGAWIDCNAATLTNNTVADNTAAAGGGGGIGMLLYDDTDTADLYNNIIWRNHAPQGADLFLRNDGNNNTTPSPIDLFHNDFDWSTIFITLPFPIDASNLNNQNPLFVNPGIEDYHLLVGSPVINQGDNMAPAIPAQDKDGNPRIQGGVVDLGAYEYGAGGTPIPDIKANGADGPLTIAPGSNLTVTVALNPGAQAGANADWWVAAQSPFGLYWYTLGGWVRSDAPIRVYGGPLFALAPYTVLNTTGLPVGAYTFYFGVDMLMNGSLDFGQLHVDSVGVTIQ